MPKPAIAPLDTTYFVNPLNAVIVRSVKGRFQAVSDYLDSAALGVKPPQIGGRFRPGLIGRARQTLAFVSPGPIANYDMYAAVLDGITVRGLLDNPDVAAVYPDAPISILGFPVVPNAGTWHLRTTQGTMNITTTGAIKKAIGAEDAASSGYDGKGVTVAVCDTGSNKTNPMLRKMYKSSVYPFNYFDENGHGTHVAAAIGGQPQTDLLLSKELGPPSLDLEGMATGCTLLAVKTLGFVIGTAPTSALIRGVALAEDSGADIINCSWGSPVTQPSPANDPLSPVFESLDAKGIIAVCAAGNSGPNAKTVVSPAALPQPLAVGAYNAVDNDITAQFGAAGEICGFSSRGPSPYPGVGLKPDLAMPGAIYDSAIRGAYATTLEATYTQRPHLYQALAGTSQAAPIASGLIACMRQALLEAAKVRLTADMVRAIVKTGGYAANYNWGYGVLTWALFKNWAKNTYGVTI